MTTEGTCDEAVWKLNSWSLAQLPLHNRQILAGHSSAEDLVHALNNEALSGLPQPELLTRTAARQAIVHLGIYGSSVGRHFQERQKSLKSTPEVPLNSLVVGVCRTPFLAYFERLTAYAGSGHPARDAYASLVRWNVPTVEVCQAGERLVVLPGVFGDGDIRTFTGASTEREFFAFLKKAEAVESAANMLLMPLLETVVDLTSCAAVKQIQRASEMMAVVHRLNLEFAGKPAETRMSSDHFMDVFRQFGVHWRVNDLPPSGAQDVEYLKRDLIVGIDYPHYEAAVLRQFPALLDDERQALDRLMHEPSLTELMLKEHDVTVEQLQNATPDELRILAEARPTLVAYQQLLDLNARISSSHLMLTMKFLFKPIRAREAAGIADSGVVSNRAGSTGMLERYLVALTRARKNHALAAFRRIPQDELARLARIETMPTVSSDELPHIIRLAA